MSALIKIPDLEGGFIYKSVEGNMIVTRDNDGNILNEKPINLIKKGVATRYGTVIEHSSNITVLQNGKETEIMKSFDLNAHLHKIKDIEVNVTEDAQNYFNNNIVGTYQTPIEDLTVNIKPDDIKKIDRLGLLKSLKQIITNPDLITEEDGKQIFELRNGKNIYSVAIQSDENLISDNPREVKFLGKTIYTKKREQTYIGDILSCNTRSKEVKKANVLNLFGSTPKEPKIDDISSGPAWNVKGGQKPDHKYIERKPHPSGHGYIYLYELPNGQREWKDDSGKTVKEEGRQKPTINDYKKGDRVKRGDQVGKIEDVSDNFLAVNFEGKIETINKKEHLEKVKKHSQLKEGMEFEHKGNPVRALRVTDKLALVKDLQDNSLKVIRLEKELQKQKDEKKISRDYPKSNIEYEQQDLFQDFDTQSNAAGLARVDDLTRKKYVKVGDQIRTVTWKYDPQFGDTTFLIDGVKDYPLTFGGEKFVIRDITEEGFSLEDREGNTGIFLSHEDYESWKDEAAAIREKNTVVRHEREGTYAGDTSKTFHYKPEYTAEELEQLRGTRGRRSTSYRSRWRRSEPMQSDADKARLAAEQEKVNEEIRTSLKSEEYEKFSQFHESRGYKIQENKFIAKKEIDIEGNKFELRSHYDRKSGTWETKVEGKVKDITIGDQKFKIDDITADTVYYDGDKGIGIEDLKQLNGKAIFKPTQESIGITSKNNASKTYFGTDDKNAVSTYYEVIEADDLIASHFSNGEINKDYSIGDAQNRDRSTPQSIGQITKIATNPNFDFLGDNRTAEHGAPIVNQDYNVIAGNGRGIGVQKHYQDGGMKYKQDLLSNAERLGFSPDQISQMNKPILVRRTNVDNKEAQRLGAISNQDQKLALENREAAKGMATRIDDKTMNRLSDIFGKAKGDHSTLAAYLDEVGPDVVNELIRKDIIPDNEKHLFYDSSSGNLNAAHKDKIKDLLTQTMLGDSSQSFEHIPDSSREGITKALGNIFALKGKDGDLTDHLQGAVNILARYNTVKDNFNSADDFISQDANNVFEPLKASKEELAIFDLLTNSKPNEIKNKFQEYAAALEGDMFTPGMTPDEAFNQAFSPKYAEGINQKPLSKSALKEWMGNSKLVDKKGKPLTLYHGTNKSFDTFKGNTIWFSTDSKLANEYAGMETGANVIPVNAKIEQPFEVRKAIIKNTERELGLEAIDQAKKLGKLEDKAKAKELLQKLDSENKIDSFKHWDTSENLIELLTHLGFDGIESSEGESKTYAVFNPNQVKSIHNKGTYSDGGNILRSVFQTLFKNIQMNLFGQNNPDLVLQPSKKNPNVKRWQNINEPDEPEKKTEKQPYELTKKDWESKKEDSKSNYVQSNYTRNSKSEAVRKFNQLQWLNYGAHDELSQKLKAAMDGDIEMTPEEADDIQFELSKPVTHYDVIKKALKEGKKVPPEVLEDYPDLKGQVERGDIYESARKFLNGKSKVGHKDFNEFNKQHNYDNDLLYIKDESKPTGQNRVHILDVIAYENLQKIPKDKLLSDLTKLEKNLDKLNERRHKRISAGRTPGAGAGGFNRDVGNINHAIDLDKHEIKVIKDELERRELKNSGRNSTNPNMVREGIGLNEMLDYLQKYQEQYLEEQMEFGFDESSEEYKTTENKSIRFKTKDSNPSLRKLAAGEYCSIERKYRTYKQLDFYSRTEKIESADDVAFIFRSLEEESVEHAFALHETYNGELIVQQISQGNFDSAIVDPRLMADSVSRFNTKKLYFVHNHPSGTLEPSFQDLQIRDLLTQSMPSHVTEFRALIIDAREGKYIDFSMNTRNEPGQVIDDRKGRKLKAVTFSRQVHRDVNLPEIKATHPDMIASFLTETRFAVGKKFHLMSLSPQNQIVSHFILTKPIDSPAVVDEIRALNARGGGSSFILVGNRFDDETIKAVNEIQGRFDKHEMKDYIGIETDIENYKSAVLYNKLASIGLTLKKAINKLTNQLKPSSKNPNVKRWQKVEKEEKITDTENFKKWFKDSKVVDSDGNPKIVYHQTSKEAAESIYDSYFDIHRGRARLSDEQVPDGFFFKPDEKDIGITGNLTQEHIPVYLSLQNPLIVLNRRDMLNKLDFETYQIAKFARDEDTRIGKRYDAWEKAFRAKLLEKYSDAKDREKFANEYKRAGKFIETWKKYNNKQSAKARAAITKFLEKNGYDGVIMKKDEGSFGRVTETYIALYPNQIKSATKNSGKFSITDPSIVAETKVKYGDKMGAIKPSEFSEQQHEGQKYGNGKPYFTAHIKPVTKKAVEIAKDLGYEDTGMIEAVGYLHDVLEDTTTTFEALRKRFGYQVAYNVYLLSNKIKSEGKNFTKEEYYNHISKSEIAKIVKAADRIVNIRKTKEIKTETRRNELRNKYKKEMKYYEEHDIFPELVRKAFDE